MGNLATSTESASPPAPGQRHSTRGYLVDCLGMIFGVCTAIAAFSPHPAAVFATLKSTRRVIVLTPTHWPNGEYRNCVVGEPAKDERLNLECAFDDIFHSRVLIMDVRFDGNNYGQVGVHWTCQNRDGKLVCKN